MKRGTLPKSLKRGGHVSPGSYKHDFPGFQPRHNTSGRKGKISLEKR